MAVLQAFRRSPGALVRSPALLVPAFVLFLFQVPQLVLQSTSPLLASVVSLGASLLLLLAIPFFQGGMVGMADEALDGRSSLSAFLAHGKANYVQILVAYLLVVVVNFVLGAVLVAVGFGALLSGAFHLGTLALVTLGIVAAVLVIIYLLLAFFIQFYAQAIVLEGYSAVDGLKRSYSVVRSNLGATFGYMVLAFVISVVLGLSYGGLSLLTTPEAAAEFGLPVLSTGGLVGVGLVMTLVGSVVSAFLLVYSVAFYRLVTR
ncbi:hypothetical protein [Halopelagius fulvigenes]|uniref:DUF7847 domain-containing protein n=1 Tax=Halopelagius fulvigenes TaxID=1198324 RepID=A0ABD5U1J8_9EURY